MRTMRCLGFTVVVVCALNSGACSSEERPPAEPAPIALPTPAAAAQPEVVEAEPTAEELPVEDDFDVEAEQQITPENFRAELDALEKEIDAEK